MTRPSLKLAVVAGIAAATLVGTSLGVVSAQWSTDLTSVNQAKPAGVPKTKPNGQGRRPQRPTAEQIQQRKQQYIDLLAKNLNLPPATVKTALEKTHRELRAARIAEIQQAAKDGKLTQERANQMIQHIQSGQGHPGPGSGPRGGPGR